MNQFMLEPTDENLERLKQGAGGQVYWHTADFFLFDPTLEGELSALFDAYMDALIQSGADDEEEAMRKIGISIGRKLVKAARTLGISPQEYRDQFNNYVTVLWTPICLWRKDESGRMAYSLMSQLPKAK